jgi:hypothetical protein
VGVEDWNWQLAADPQDYPWDCAACSLAWCLRSVGFTYTEQDVIAGLGPSRISPTHGLLDASGAGLVEYLAEIGVQSDNNPAANWTECAAAAGYQPMLIGGRRWCHWTGVRMGPFAAERPDLEIMLLMNPADGYMNVSQSLVPGQFDQLGPFSAVWFTSW